MEAARGRLSVARELRRLAPGDLPPGEVRALIDQRAAIELRRVREPAEPTCDRRPQVDSGRALEGEEGHRSHRVLMDGVDGVSFDDIPGPSVVVPPPLPVGTLTGADCTGALKSHVPRFRVAEHLGVSCKSVDRIHEIGKAGDVPAETLGPSI